MFRYIGLEARHIGLEARRSSSYFATNTLYALRQDSALLWGSISLLVK